MAGTVAGADTIIVITRSEEDAEHFIERIENMIFKIESINRREFFLGRIESYKMVHSGIALDKQHCSSSRWLQDKNSCHERHNSA